MPVCLSMVIVLGFLLLSFVGFVSASLWGLDDLTLLLSGIVAALPLLSLTRPHRCS